MTTDEPETHEQFVGILEMRCNAPGCPCHITCVVNTSSLVLAWAQFRAGATEYGWVCTPWAQWEGPHYCACDHSRDGAYDPR